MLHVLYVDALLGYNLTDSPSWTNQYDFYVQNSTLNELIKYVCMWIYFVSEIYLSDVYVVL